MSAAGARESGRKHRVAFDHAGVAVGGFLPRLAPIDERDGEPALGEMQRDRGADDAGAEHDRVRASHGIFPVEGAGSRLEMRNGTTEI